PNSARTAPGRTRAGSRCRRPAVRLAAALPARRAGDTRRRARPEAHDATRGQRMNDGLETRRGVYGSRPPEPASRRRISSRQRWHTTCTSLTNSNHMEVDMNWDRIEGNWKQMVGQARQRWGKL